MILYNITATPGVATHTEDDFCELDWNWLGIGLDRIVCFANRFYFTRAADFDGPDEQHQHDGFIEIICIHFFGRILRGQSW